MEPKRKSPLWKLVAGLNGLLLGALLCLLLYGYYLSFAEKEKAEAGGRIVHIDVESGEVTGGLRTSEPLPPISPPAPGASSAAPPAETPPVPAPVVIAPLPAGISDKSALLPPQGDGLKPAPNPALSEQSPEGMIPRVGEDGIKPWQYYSRNYEKREGTQVAVLIVGVGLSKNVSDAAVRLPPEISLSLSPYAGEAAMWAVSARALGHEVFVDLPLEPSAYPVADAGPLALQTNTGSEINNQKIRKVLAQFPGVVGVYLPAEQRFTSERRDLATASLRYLATRGIIGITGDTSGNASIMSLLGTETLPVLQADVRLERDSSADEARAQFKQIESIVRQKGSSLIVVPAAPAAVKALSEWVERIGEKGVILVPVSALARKKFS